jgi:DNA-binding NarL/FixJ family response regulator
MCTQKAAMVSSFQELPLGKRAEGPIKVLVADDTQLMRRAICGFLRGKLEIEIVGEAADYAQTVQMANDFRPEIILMDLHLASGCGFYFERRGSKSSGAEFGRGHVAG